MRRRAGVVAWWVLVVVVLYPAIALTVVRLVQPHSGPAIRLESFVPFGLLLYAAALVVLLVGAWRRAAGRRTAPLLVSLVAIAGLVLHGWWAAPMWVGQAPAPVAGGETLTVMTANLFEGQGDTTALVEAVRREHVDVLVVEEVSMDALLSADAAGLATVLPYRIGGPNGYDPVSGTMVLADQPLGEPTRVETYHDSWLVDVGAGPSTLTVLGVHPVAPVTPEQWRADHAAVLAAARSAEPDLVLGDFNATDDHEPMRALTAAGYRDAAAMANEGWQPTWPAHGLHPVAGIGVPPLVRIDHVLVSDRWTALSTHTVDIPGSDHLALVAEVAQH